MALIEAGPFHRLAVAVDDAAAAYPWFERVLGAVRRGPLIEAGVIPRDQSGRELRIDEADLAGTDLRSFSLSGVPFVMLASGVPDGPVAGFLRRYGPGVHSLAWEVDDMWSAQNLLAASGIRIASVNVPGRHFYTHPRDCHGLLIEWTDVRAGTSGAGPVPGVVQVDGLAWITAAVDDAEGSAAFLVSMAGAKPVESGPRGPRDREVTADVAFADMRVRLVTPRAADSPYAPFLAAGPRLCSFALRVANLDNALCALEREGVPTVRRDGGLAATDPEATFGLAIEWTGAEVAG